MIPEKIRSMRRSLVRNNLVTTLCLVLVLVCFLLNYLERREERLERMRYAYYVAADGGGDSCAVCAAARQYRSGDPPSPGHVR